jgi:rfaE bifunctional protein kinase chain/domain
LTQKAEIENLFAELAGQKVIIAGDVMLDVYLHGNVDRISPEAPVPVVAVDKKENRLGGAANVAMNIKSMGATPFLVSVIGDDEAGKQFLALLNQNAIDQSYIISDSSRITTTKTRVIAKNNQVLRLDEEDVHDVNDTLSQTALQHIKNLIENEHPSVLIFQDYNKGFLTERFIREVTVLCLNNNIPVAVDPKKHNFFAYQLCTLFKPNLREIEDSLRITVDPGSMLSLNEAVLKLHKEIHHGISLITLGDKGMYLKAADVVIKEPAHVRNVADVSGAGDTVISIAALCLAAKTSLATLTALSNIAGGIVCEYPGVVQINRERLMEEAKELL